MGQKHHKPEEIVAKLRQVDHRTGRDRRTLSLIRISSTPNTGRSLIWHA